MQLGAKQTDNSVFQPIVGLAVSSQSVTAWLEQTFIGVGKQNWFYFLNGLTNDGNK